MNRFCPVILLLAATLFFTSFSTPPVYYRDKVIVLMYHHLDVAENDATLSPATFASHLDALIEKGYHVISMEDYLEFIHTGKSLPPNAVVLTFDDGYESFYTYAYPELKERGLPAANFLIVKATDVPDPQALPHLTWEQIREMKAHNMSFYNHTYDQHKKAKTDRDGMKKPVLAHPVYLEREHRRETQEEYRSRVKADLALAEQRLHAELGQQPSLLAFPYGAYHDEVIEIARQMGFELFFTVEEGINDRNQRLVFRINANGLSAEDLIRKLGKYSEW